MGFLPIIVIAIVIITNSVRIVKEYERGVIFRLGRLVGTRGPGLIILIPGIEKMVKDILRDLLITNIKMSDFTFSRKISVHGDSIEFIDTIDQIARIKRIFIGVKASYVYGPSTRFFRPSYSPVMVEYRQKDLLEFKDKGSVTIRRKFDKHGKLSSIHME